MSRETKEQRREREASEAIAQELLVEEYRKTIPKRLIDAQALATSLDISTEVKLSEHGPRVFFYIDGSDFSTNVTYNTEQWELESLENRLCEMKIERDARAGRRQLAQDIFDRLNTEEKNALKENIHWVK